LEEETALHEVKIDHDKCVYCKSCIVVCPWGVYVDKGDRVEPEKAADCVACMSCVPVCPVEAITVREEM
jgi:NAD-dependent dihydropyrimidine dehydrogenase PreA subunit